MTLSETESYEERCKKYAAALEDVRKRMERTSPDNRLAWLRLAEELRELSDERMRFYEGNAPLRAACVSRKGAGNE